MPTTGRLTRTGHSSGLTRTITGLLRYLVILLAVLLSPWVWSVLVSLSRRALSALRREMRLSLRVLRLQPQIALRLERSHIDSQQRARLMAALTARGRRRVNPANDC